MARPAADAETQALIEETWAALERLEHQHKQFQRALKAATDPEIRARRWQTLARLEEEMDELDAQLSAIQRG